MTSDFILGNPIRNPVIIFIFSVVLVVTLFVSQLDAIPLRDDTANLTFDNQIVKGEIF